MCRSRAAEVGGLLLPSESRMETVGMQDAIRKLLNESAFKDYAALTKERNFNAFDVLRYSDYEIRHSNVLKWLLTPGDTHGVRDAFVKKLVECLQSKEHSGRLKRLDVAAGFAAEDVRVERERDYVDVMVFVEKEPRVLLVVENKPCRRTPDHVKQLRGYVEEQCEKHGASYSVQGVLLTASRSGDPKHEDYLHLSWHEVRCLVGSFLDEGRVSSDEVKALLRQYIDIVDRNILGRGPSSDCFRRLLKDHGATLEKMLREWKPGKMPKKWPVSRADSRRSRPPAEGLAAAARGPERRRPAGSAEQGLRDSGPDRSRWDGVLAFLLGPPVAQDRKEARSRTSVGGWSSRIEAWSSNWVALK